LKLIAVDRHSRCLSSARPHACYGMVTNGCQMRRRCRVEAGADVCSWH